MIKDNPFYILNIPMSATKGGIYSAVEDLSLMYDAATCEDAASALISPAKRLKAELDWFPECDETLIRKIRAAVNSGKLIGDIADADTDAGDLDELTGIGKVNAMVYDFGLLMSGERANAAGGGEPEPAASVAEVGGIVDYVIEIDDCFRKFNSGDLCRAINENRAAAGITEVTRDAVEETLRLKRTGIAMEISESLKQLGSEEYVELANVLAEHLRENVTSGFARSIIPDLIDRYEIQEQQVIQAQTKKIKRATFWMTLSTILFGYESKIDAFCAKIEVWLRYVRPLITAAAQSGSENKYVTMIAEDFREMLRMAAKNTQHLAVYKMAVRLKEYFADVPSIVKWLDEYIEEAAKRIEWFHHRSPEEWDEVNTKVSKAIIKWILIIIIGFAAIVTVKAMICALIR